MSSPITAVGNVYNPKYISLYQIYNSSLGNTSNPTGSPLINVSNYNTKSVFAFLHTTQNVSGSLVVSGSFDGTNTFLLRSGSFNSGSFIYFTFYDAVPWISVWLNHSGSGLANSGSLYLSGMI